MIIQLPSHPLLTEIFNNNKPYLDYATAELLKRVEETGEIRNPKNVSLDDKQYFHISVFHKVSAIISGVDRLDYAKKYIERFPSPRTYERKGITQYMWIEYHYSFFVITVDSLFDMALILINEIFQLGNSERNCTPNIIKKNSWIKKSAIASSLGKLEKVTSSYRPIRNLYVHRGEVPDILSITESDTLDLLKLYSSVRLHSDPIIDVSILDSVFNYESKKICSELENEIEKVCEIIWDLFTNLLPKYKSVSKSFEAH